MLHVTTEVGKPGFKEREKRHFPDLMNKKGVLPAYKPRGRRYIPHMYGVYDEWRPHPQNVQMEYSENGPDWKSKIKYIPDPQNPRYPAAEIFENNWHAMRPYPFTYMRTSKEWLLDPEMTGGGIRCNFDGHHKATRTSHNELTHQMLFGRGRYTDSIDRRNGLGEASPGDKSYQVPEYSPDFHKGGTSLPVIDFGAHVPKETPETFIPLQSLPQSPREPFKVKDNRRQKEEEVKVVKALEDWRPATPLKAPVLEEKK